MYQVTRMVLQLTPLGVLGLMAWVIGEYGIAKFIALAKFVGVIYLAVLIHIVVVYGGFSPHHGGHECLAIFPSRVRCTSRCLYDLQFIWFLAGGTSRGH